MPGYCSLCVPHMYTDPNAIPAKACTDTTTTVSNNLIQRHNISWLYTFAAAPDREHYFDNNVVLMSLNKACVMYDFKVQANQSRVFDFAYRYVGMGHVIVYFADLKSSGRIYSRQDGGSNGWERMHNFKTICQWSGDNHGPEGYVSIPYPDSIFLC